MKTVKFLKLGGEKNIVMISGHDSSSYVRQFSCEVPTAAEEKFLYVSVFSQRCELSETKELSIIHVRM